MPDLPGCFTSGETVKDAQTQAVEAIKCYLAGLLLDSETIPTPQNIATQTENGTALVKTQKT